jgi:hypothetical protein
LKVSSQTEDSPDATPPARPLRSMHTGQNSIAPESSLPQLGQVRWGSVLTGLSALQPKSKPKATPRSTEWCRKRPARTLANRRLVAQAIAHYVILARQITFRNIIPIAGVLRRPVLITSLGDEAVRNSGPEPSTFKVTVNHVVTPAPAKQLPDRANAGRAVRCK